MPRKDEAVEMAALSRFSCFSLPFGTCYGKETQHNSVGQSKAIMKTTVLFIFTPLHPKSETPLELVTSPQKYLPLAFMFLFEIERLIELG